MRVFRYLAVVAAWLLTHSIGLTQAPPLKLLFLGDNGHHRPAERFRQLQPVLSQRGIEIVYTDSAAALNAQTLGKYDGLIVYANNEKITPEQETALLDFVASGKGFIPLHCASYCFLNSPKYIELVGAQFLRHGTGTFRTTIAKADHPIMKGYRGFESFDETYVHTKHNDNDRTVLEYREDKKGKEPWTWVRTHGKGRVFYTAWGHDERTWGNEGFQELVERGIRWACGSDTPSPLGGEGRVRGNEPPKMTELRKDVLPFKYAEAKVPLYAGKKGGKSQQSTMQLPLDPAESMKHMVHPVEFELKLFASEPQIKRPICMNWDERGRLWIAETVDYPNELKKSGEGRDRITICEDTDADGVADKFTVFADKLSIPTSFVFYKDGIIVTQAPHTLFLRSTKGDDVCDERKILFTGWHTGDTHAGPSNLVYGFDNWIYGIVGYSGFDGVVGGERHSFKQGFFRFKVESRSHAPRGNAAPDAPRPESKPDVPQSGKAERSHAERGNEVVVTKLEFLRSTNNNSWGVGFSEDGLLFGSTANGNPSVYLPIPNRYYESVRGWSSKVLGGIAGNAPMFPITDKVRQVDFHGRFTAAAGHALYTARTYPKQYWNRTAFICEPTGHLVSTFVIDKQGTDFKSRNAWNLLASDDEWSAPIMAEVGPDGNVWVIDWYNYIVQHNPTPAGFKTGKGNAYETPLRDKTHGRIYRLVMKGRAGSVSDRIMTLKVATPDKLVATLKHDNLFWRKQAQRQLIERGKLDVVPALARLAQDANVDEIGLNAGAVHALWTMNALNAFALNGRDNITLDYEEQAKSVLVDALRHKSAAVRRAAAQVGPRNAWWVARMLDANTLGDSDPHVRLAALLTIAEIPGQRGVQVALARMLQEPTNLDDAWLPDAITAAAARNDALFLSSAAIFKKPHTPRAHQVIGIVAEHYARGAPVKAMQSLFTPLSVADPQTAETIIAAMARSWPKGQKAVLDPQAEREFETLMAKMTPSARTQLFQLAVKWGHQGLEKQVRETVAALLGAVNDDKRSEQERLSAARQAVELQSDDAGLPAKLLAAVTPATTPQLAVGLVESLGISQAPGLGALLVKKMPGLTPSVRVAAVRVLLGRPESTRALLDAVDKGQVQLGELALDQKQALAAHPDKAIAKRARALLERGGGLPSADRQKVIDQFTPLLAKTGDPKEGKLVFKKHCAVCHTHSGEGQKIGPDLTGMAVHPKHELLVQVMDPSRSVEGNYRLYQVVTEDGKVMNGLLASETKTAIELYDVEGKKHVVQRDNISQLIATTKSLMPEGFEKQLKEPELIDLLEFLTQRGKFLPLSLAKVASAVSTRGMFFSEDAQVERLVFKDWGPQTFDGVPFHLVDPQGDRVPNAILFYGPQGKIPPKMPKSVSLPCNTPAKAIHFLSGVSGWGYPYSEKGTVSLIVRLHYAGGKTEDHALKNGEHFADYIRRVDVPGSKFAFGLRGQQIRYLAVIPQTGDLIERIELVKGPDATAPVVMAVTVETR